MIITEQKTVSGLNYFIFQLKALGRNQKLITKPELLNLMPSGILSLPDRWKMDKDAEVQHRVHREAIHEMIHRSANEDMKVGYNYYSL